MKLLNITHFIKSKFTAILLVIACVSLALSIAQNLRGAKHHHHDHAMQTWVADTIFLKHLSDSKSYYDGIQKIIAQNDREKIQQGYPSYISDMVDTWDTTQEIARQAILPTLTSDERATVIINLDKMLMLQNKFHKEDPTSDDCKIYDSAVQSILDALNHKVINDEMRLLHLSLVE